MSLATLGVATSRRAPALAAFNLGIDVAQTVVVLTVIAALWFISQVFTDRMAWVRVPSAALAAVIGVAWTVIDSPAAFLCDPKLSFTARGGQ